MLCAPMSLFAQKFGKVNTETIIQSLPEVAKAKGELEAQSKVYENDLKAMNDELQRKAAEYDKNQATMNATAKAQKEQELQTLNQKLQQTYQDNQQALQKKQQELMQPIFTKVRNAINAVGTAGGYTYIFEEGAAVFTGAAVKDVTSEVQAKLK